MLITVMSSVQTASFRKLTIGELLMRHELNVLLNFRLCIEFMIFIEEANKKFANARIK